MLHRDVEALFPVSDGDGENSEWYKVRVKGKTYAVIEYINAVNIEECLRKVTKLHPDAGVAHLLAKSEMRHDLMHLGWVTA